MSRILVVEDDKYIRDAISILLDKNGYEVLFAEDGVKAVECMQQNPDMVVMDVMMPNMDGVEACRKIRHFSNIPILFLTAKSQIMDKMEGLEAGGDDYLVKPFHNEELLARISALLRRYNEYKGNENTSGSGYIISGDLRVSEKYNEVWKNDEKIELSETEYQLLKLFMSNKGRILSGKMIYESVWDEPYFYDSNNVIMVTIRRLRVKIEDDSKKPTHIVTEWGRGYKFV
ncbi:MAG: response regulator transcription factor [Eubacterium sp.]|nr:response regulator transcription factor [Eubacterium sp.]